MFESKNYREKTSGGANAFGPTLALMLLTTLAPPVLAQSAAIRPCKTQSADEQTATCLEKADVNETLIDEKLPADAGAETLLQPYAAKIRSLEVVIGTLQGDLIKGGMGGGSMGNFVADAVRTFSSAKLRRPITLTVMNSGGLRKNSISHGHLRVNDIFELLPFENALVQIDFSGAQLLRLLGVVMERRDAQSGARIKYRVNAEKKAELISARLLAPQGRERTINPRATYSIVTIDYLLKLGSGSYAILQEGKNAKPLGVTLRDAVIQFVKTETAKGHRVTARLDGRFSNIEPYR
ncbi:MAG TPA: 5'-nucleotidase C-terminal domain-containing protein [Pyrinomonadaceae bacterium]|nr:5'-nucleotidase C-terminal domain-containing protein [Pyrinomonadaceae bacterium]